MIYRLAGKVKLWKGVRPSGIKCIDEGSKNCNHTYYIEDGENIYSFDDWQEAENKFCELSGTNKFVFGKTDFMGNF